MRTQHGEFERDGKAFVSRAGVGNGFRMTNIERAKDTAEMQETMAPRLLHKYGLLLPALAERDYRAP